MYFMSSFKRSLSQIKLDSLIRFLASLKQQPYILNWIEKVAGKKLPPPQRISFCSKKKGGEFGDFLEEIKIWAAAAEAVVEVNDKFLVNTHNNDPSLLIHSVFPLFLKTHHVKISK